MLNGGAVASWTKLSRAKMWPISLRWDTAYAVLWLASAAGAGRNSRDEMISETIWTLPIRFHRQPHAAGKHRGAVWALDVAPVAVPRLVNSAAKPVTRSGSSE
jgi:hypothetical protein